MMKMQAVNWLASDSVNKLHAKYVNQVKEEVGDNLPLVLNLRFHGKQMIDLLATGKFIAHCRWN